ncbi:MAG: fumarylacetoacetate hydrolase family protein [Pirellulaceae bacterium]|nr:fumarylacetoacetate hydrolase family protein [Pirellulaceae bacterium]
MRYNLLTAVSLVSFLCIGSTLDAETQRFVRFEVDGTPVYGIVEGERVWQLDGDLFGDWKKTDAVHELSSLKLLPPAQPTQVLALAGNYRSHLKDEVVSPRFQIPQPFYKSPSCLVAHGQPIIYPKDATTVHYEAELVVVIGKRCRNVSPEQAMGYVFGVTAGNDVSERVWQNDQNTKDVQWWRAKGADTFGPVGPFLVRGLDYGNLLLRLRLNGQVRQEERTDHFLHDIPTAVSFISQYVTLNPGDMIFTGTPGKTDVIQPGDIVEVELEGVGVLRNPVVAE